MSHSEKPLWQAGLARRLREAALMRIPSRKAFRAFDGMLDDLSRDHDPQALSDAVAALPMEELCAVLAISDYGLGDTVLHLIPPVTAQAILNRKARGEIDAPCLDMMLGQIMDDRHPVVDQDKVMAFFWALQEQEDDRARLGVMEWFHPSAFSNPDAFEDQDAMERHLDGLIEEIDHDLPDFDEDAVKLFMLAVLKDGDPAMFRQMASHWYHPVTGMRLPSILEQEPEPMAEDAEDLETMLRNVPRLPPAYPAQVGASSALQVGGPAAYAGFMREAVLAAEADVQDRVRQELVLLGSSLAIRLMGAGPKVQGRLSRFGNLLLNLVGYGLHHHAQGDVNRAAAWMRGASVRECFDRARAIVEPALLFDENGAPSGYLCDAEAPMLDFILQRRMPAAQRKPFFALFMIDDQRLDNDKIARSLMLAARLNRVYGVVRHEYPLFPAVSDRTTVDEKSVLLPFVLSRLLGVPVRSRDILEALHARLKSEKSLLTGQEIEESFPDLDSEDAYYLLGIHEHAVQRDKEGYWHLQPLHYAPDTTVYGIPFNAADDAVAMEQKVLFPQHLLYAAMGMLQPFPDRKPNLDDVRLWCDIDPSETMFVRNAWEHAREALPKTDPSRSLQESTEVEMYYDGLDARLHQTWEALMDMLDQADAAGISGTDAEEKAHKEAQAEIENILAGLTF